MNVHTSLPVGQDEARTRWGTHESGAAFDKKKTTYLTKDAKDFIARQGLCAIAGLDATNQVHGLLVTGDQGFVQTSDAHNCLLPVKKELTTSHLLRSMWQRQSNGYDAKLGFFFINHPTKERLCVQGTAKLSADQSNTSHVGAHIALNVQQAFFHCAKYVRTKVPGLTSPDSPSTKKSWNVEKLLDNHHDALTEDACTFIEERVLCFVCTVDQHEQCAINHRGGAPGFLVTLPPHADASGGEVLLPDYEGNGAFEAIGNILETGKAALLLPDYTSKVALSVSGSAKVVELGELSEDLVKRCSGAQRVVVLSVQSVELQQWD